MSTTIARSSMFTVYTTVNEERLKQFRRSPEICLRAMQTGANYWHTGILPEHFKKPASAMYGYARRSTAYLKSPKKGSKPDLVQSGSMRRELLARAEFRAMRTGVELRMHARILNVLPNMPQNSLDHFVRQKVGKKLRNYPNLKREIKVVTQVEAELIAQIVTAEIERLFNAQDTAYFPTEGV